MSRQGVLWLPSECPTCLCKHHPDGGLPAFLVPPCFTSELKSPLSPSPSLLQAAASRTRVATSSAADARSSLKLALGLWNPDSETGRQQLLGCGSWKGHFRTVSAQAPRTGSASVRVARCQKHLRCSGRSSQWKPRLGPLPLPPSMASQPPESLLPVSWPV